VKLPATVSQHLTERQSRLESLAGRALDRVEAAKAKVEAEKNDTREPMPVADRSDVMARAPAWARIDTAKAQLRVAERHAQAAARDLEDFRKLAAQVAEAAVIVRQYQQTLEPALALNAAMVAEAHAYYRSHSEKTAELSTMHRAAIDAWNSIPLGIREALVPPLPLAPATSPPQIGFW